MESLQPEVMASPEPKMIEDLPKQEVTPVRMEAAEPCGEVAVKDLPQVVIEDASPIICVKDNDTSFKNNEFQDFVQSCKEEKPAEELFQETENSPILEPPKPPKKPTRVKKTHRPTHTWTSSFFTPLNL